MTRHRACHSAARSERSVALREWKSATDSKRRRAFQGLTGVHLILANPPSVSYKSAPRGFRETRSTHQDSLAECLWSAVQNSTETPCLAASAVRSSGNSWSGGAPGEEGPKGPGANGGAWSTRGVIQPLKRRNGWARRQNPHPRKRKGPGGWPVSTPPTTNQFWLSIRW